MPDPRTDQIAREAARLIQIGRAETIGDAIHRASDRLGFSGVPLPGANRVRKHAQAMSMQAMGSAAYEQERLKVLEIAEQIMTALEHTMPDVKTLLVGRAAEGNIDAGVTIHVRLYTRQPMQRVIESLAQFGYDDPEFQTIETRHGRLTQARFHEDVHEIALTRCMPEWHSESHLDLTTGRPIASLTLPALQRMIQRRI